ncbi:MAG: flippase-like domain-containing protein [Candidatus Omnitrophica bacterium]|nr:flippase-like domain-containing protein [Candidatus Omnitrophota bacterium]
MGKNAKLSVILRLLVSFGLLGALAWILRKDFSEIKMVLAAANKETIGVAMAIFVVLTVWLALRMKVVFEGENLSLSFIESLELTWMGYFFNNFMPTSVGGDIVKAHLSVKSKEERIRSYASVLMDRLIGLYSFLLFAGIALVVDKGKTQIPLLRPVVFSLIAVGVLIFMAVTSMRIAKLMEKTFVRFRLWDLGNKLDSVYKIVHDYRNRIDVVMKAIIISFVNQCLFFYAIYLFLVALGTDIRLGQVFLLMPIVVFISMVPSIGGLGVREGAMVALFAPFVGKEAAFAASILHLFGLICISFLGGGSIFLLGNSA